LKTSIKLLFLPTLQLHNLSVDCARELFKPSKDLASLLVYNEKKFWVGDISGMVGLGPFDQGH